MLASLYALLVNNNFVLFFVSCLMWPMCAQLLCAISPLYTESCVDTQRLKVAVLSSVGVFLVFLSEKVVFVFIVCEQ